MRAALICVLLLLACRGPRPTILPSPLAEARSSTVEDALEPPLSTRAVALLDTRPVGAGRVRELFGKTACGGHKGVNPYIVAQPRPTVGSEWRCLFTTSACPNPPPEDWPSWLIVSYRPPQEDLPIDFSNYGMKGCWLLINPDEVVPIPAKPSADSFFERDGGRIWLRWQLPDSTAGLRVWFQFVTLSPSGLLSSHAIEVFIGK